MVYAEFGGANRVYYGEFENRELEEFQVLFTIGGFFYKAGILMKHVTQALLKIQIHLKGLATLCRIIFHTFLVS